MKMKYLQIFGALFILNNTYATTLQDNCLYSNAITGFELNSPLSYSVSNRQPFGGVSVNFDISYSCLDVKAGRENEKSNREWVENGMKDAGITWDKNHMFSTVDSSTPDKLNFAILGTLYLNIHGIDYTCPNVYIGQGHVVADGENWWIFSNNSVMDQTLLCKDNLMNDVYIYNARVYDSHNKLYPNSIIFLPKV